MARASKEERKKAIDDIPAIPGGPFWRRLGPYGPAVPVIPEVAKELAKLMIDHEESLFKNPVGDDIAMLEQAVAAVNQRMNEIRRGDPPGISGQLLEPRGGKEAQPSMKPRKKRKVSDYSKQFGIILKALKKKHPRTPVTRLMKRAHVATRKKMPKKKATPKGRLSKGRRTIAKSGQFRRDKLLPRYKK